MPDAVVTEAPVSRSVTTSAATAYVVLGAVNVVAQLAGWWAAATTTKVLLLPVLAIAFVAATRGASARLRVATLAALGLSWLGDVFLELPGPVWFVAGLGAFLASHVAYLVLFTAVLRLRRPRAWSLVYVAWFVALLAVLLPHLGALAAPVTVYGLALAAMAAFATGGGRLLAAGGAFFVVSDTVLALGRFLPGFELPGRGGIIMLTYIVAQALIVAGVVRLAGGRGAASGIVEESSAR